MPEAVLKVKELMEIPKVNQTLESCQEVSKQRFPLKDLLPLPIQRILRYPLLLKELIKTSKTLKLNDEVFELEKILMNIEDIAKHINTSKSDYENMKKVHEISRGIENLPEMKCVGKLIMDGELKVRNLQINTNLIHK